MPQKNSRKEYGVGGFYHIYNRGVEKRDIFLDEQDYKVFLGYMKFYLEDDDLQGQALQEVKVSPSKISKNYHDQIDLLAYCLMPNHFHFFVSQSTGRAIAEFMQSLVLKYVMYFNKKYKRVGGLFQSRYKTVLISNESQFVYISKYIHRNPKDILPAGPGPAGLRDYRYSSYGNYLGLVKQKWIKTEKILSYFEEGDPRRGYRNFVEDSESDDLIRVYEEMIDLDDKD